MNPAADLREILDTALARGADLLTAGELRVVDAVRALPEAGFLLFAHLTGRVDRPHRLERLPAEAADALLEAGLADTWVPWTDRARALTVPELQAACRGLGLPHAGRKEVLVARLAGRSGWFPGRWLRVRHRGLVERLERFAFLDPWPDRGALVVERLGLVRWPTYPPTRGTALFRTRAHLLRWEQARTCADPERALAHWTAGDGAAPGRLDLSWVLAERVRAGAEAAERAGDLARADRLYRAWPGSGVAIAFRWSRVLESLGEADRALGVLRAALPQATRAEATALVRAGRRLAKAQRTSFPPALPLAPRTTRHLELVAAPTEGSVRPLWHTDAGPAPIEDATVALLRALGRTAWHGEGRPWRTVVSLLLAELYFLPVPGALPVPRLAGPLDLGTPGFARARAAPLEALLARLSDRGAATLVAEAQVRWAGVRLAGVDLGVPGDVLLALAQAVPTAAWEALVALRAGGRSFGGLPDLVVLPGPQVSLPRGHPRRLPSGLVVAEIKGPTDALRDHQADWLDTLASLGLAVELWEIGPAVWHGARATE